MKIYSDGKTRIIKGQFPKRFKLSNAGVDVPFLRTAEDTIRLSGEIPFGALDVLEIEKKKTAQPAKLDAASLAIINKADFDRIDLLNKKLAINQDQMNAHLAALTEQEATLANLETQNANDIVKTNETIVEVAKQVGREIQNDREALKQTAQGISKALTETSEILSAKIEAHELAKNPHKITKATIGLDKVDNTSDLDKPISKATKKALDKKVDKSELEEVNKKLTEARKKHESFVRSIENANLYGGVGGNELPTGGKEGQFLAKGSDKTGDYKWVTPDPSIEIVRVDELPATGETNILYLVPVDDPETNNIYDEYIWTIQPDETYGWEKLGTTEVDLSGYVPTSRTINNKALTEDITLTPADVGAQPAGNYVTTDTAQTISEAKTFTKAVHFTGTGDTNAVFLTENTRIDVEGTTRTILGMGNGQFYINHSAYDLLLRGRQTRPKYNSSDLALTSDIPTTYIHEQGVSSAVWTVQHNLNKYPSVTVVDSSENVIIADVEYVDVNTVKITMNGASKGRAYLN